MEIDYENIPECDAIDNYVLNRLRKGLHTHVLVTGLPGRGKSDFGIRMGERLSARIENGIKFQHTDIVDSLLKLIKRIKAIQQPGEIIMIEEVSVLFPSRRAMTQSNVAIGRILDTIRKKECILISNAPIYSSIDSHMRALAEVLVECKTVLKTYKLVQAKAWILQTAPHSGKTYRHRFRRPNSAAIVYHYSKQSDPNIRSKYEKEKDRFIDEMLEKFEQKEEKRMEKETGVKIEKQMVKEEIIKLLKQGYVPKQIAEILRTSGRNVYKHMEKLEKSGVNVRKYLPKPKIAPLNPPSEE